MSKPNSIAYYCGDCILWDPEDRGLGGSEQAVVQLSEQWVKQQYTVTVYANVVTKVLNGVVYKRWEEFDASKVQDILILWRAAGVKSLEATGKRPKARLVLLDLHDSTPTHEILPIHDYVDYYMLKSEYHASLYPHMKGKTVIVANGVQTAAYEDLKRRNIRRNPLRFCYTSSYDRGLRELLKWSWPQIHNALPGSELHVYYGYSKWETNKEELEKLMKQPGVIHHGRQPNHVVAEEKMRSSLNLYPSHAVTEIDCINVRESALAGCIPVLSNKYVFRERDGVHLVGDPLTKEFHDNYALLVVNLATQSEKELNKMRGILEKSDTIFTWEPVAKKWIEVFKQKNDSKTSFLANM